MNKKAFTLIELLIVVAIIAILAAIAVPNFLEAQTRSKISRAKADMRSIAVGVESYRVDYNNYPYPIMPSTRWNQVNDLTTPIAYLTSYPKDVFNFCDRWGTDEPNYPGQRFSPAHRDIGYKYYNLKYTGQSSPQPHTWFDLFYAVSPRHLLNQSNSRDGFILTSTGPDSAQSELEWMAVGYALNYTINGVYDPTNGTVSNGDIARVGGEHFPLVQQVLGTVR